MRSPALLLSLLCFTGAAQAAPASDTQVQAVVQALGLGTLGTDMAKLMVDNVPALNALPETDRQCAYAPIKGLLDAQFRRSVISGLGNDGDQVIAEWSRFLGTPGGKSLSSAFAGANPSTIATKANAELSEKERAEVAAFLTSPAYTRFIATLDIESELPDDIGVQLAKGLQDQCRIALNPDDIS